MRKRVALSSNLTASPLKKSGIYPQKTIQIIPKSSDSPTIELAYRGQKIVESGLRCTHTPFQSIKSNEKTIITSSDTAGESVIGCGLGASIVLFIREALRIREGISDYAKAKQAKKSNNIATHQWLINQGQKKIAWGIARGGAGAMCGMVFGALFFAAGAATAYTCLPLWIVSQGSAILRSIWDIAAITTDISDCKSGIKILKKHPNVHTYKTQKSQPGEVDSALANQPICRLYHQLRKKRRNLKYQLAGQLLMAIGRVILMVAVAKLFIATAATPIGAAFFIAGATIIAIRILWTPGKKLFFGARQYMTKTDITKPANLQSSVPITAYSTRSTLESDSETVGSDRSSTPNSSSSETSKSTLSDRSTQSARSSNTTIHRIRRSLPKKSSLTPDRQTENISVILNVIATMGNTRQPDTIYATFLMVNALLAVGIKADEIREFSHEYNKPNRDQTMIDILTIHLTKAISTTV